MYRIIFWFLFLFYIFIAYDLYAFSFSGKEFLFFNLIFISLFSLIGISFYYLLSDKIKSQQQERIISKNNKQNNKNHKTNNVSRTEKSLLKNYNTNSKKKSLGDRLADKITTILGSWGFIIAQTIILFLWMWLNVVAWMKHWDPYPFILLNLALSFQAAYSAPIIMMSQNRMTERDRKRLELDLAVTRKNDRAISKIQLQLNRIERNLREIKKNNLEKNKR